jgi:ABC-type protease/lipase transport system fused ATPase/permease subunit
VVGLLDGVSDPGITPLATVLDPIELATYLRPVLPSEWGRLRAVRLHVIQHHPGSRCTLDVALETASGWHNLTLASLRRQIALVLQETVLFYGTVRDNIAYGRPEATLDEIVKAAQAANAHEFIMALPDGYDTLIGERGVTLSGGQRQRLAIARAIIRDAPIIVLDEPTTGLDASSETLVLDGMARLMAGRTVLVIAHRLSTIMRADLILVLEHGKIVERGTHQELLAKGGRYRELYELQFRGQAPVPHSDGRAAACVAGNHAEAGGRPWRR